MLDNICSLKQDWFFYNTKFYLPKHTGVSLICSSKLVANESCFRRISGKLKKNQTYCLKKKWLLMFNFTS